MPGFVESAVLTAVLGLGRQTSGLIQVYDVVAPLDPVRAETYLSSLGAIAAL
jgi:hypothetical protein